MKKLDFIYPFSFFRGLDFTNCFTSVYMYLEKITGSNDYECAVRNGNPCNSCRKCEGSLQQIQERLFFLFDTVSGRSASIQGWKNQNTAIYNEIYDTDNMVDFLFGYIGYGYEKFTAGFPEKIRESIDNGIPVLARMKTNSNGSFRVIIGYDGDSLLMAEPVGAQNKPVKQPEIDEIENIYIIGDKTSRKYTIFDGLKRIKHVMDCDREAKVRDDYINAFSNYWGNLREADFEEIKQRFWFAHKAMTFNCHNFGQALCIYQEKIDHPEIYQNAIWDDVKLIAPHCNQIADACGDSHNRQWQVDALWGTRDWSKRFFHEWEWGMCECAVDALIKIKADDDMIYNNICEVIDKYEEGLLK
jgi:hypothetical protein